MTTFDQILQIVSDVLLSQVKVLPIVGQIFVNRDLNGRVRLVVSDSVLANTSAVDALTAIATGLQERLGPHAYPAQNAVLYEADMASITAGVPYFPLEGFEGISVIDRLATESNWASITPESDGAPRIVFFLSREVLDAPQPWQSPPGHWRRPASESSYWILTWNRPVFLPGCCL
jgi:hypothetical protein